MEAIIYSACFALVWTLYSGIVPAIKMLLNIPEEKRIKPFDCEGCMAFWCAYFWLLFEGVHPVQAFFMGCASFVLAYLIRSFIKPPGL